MNDDELDDEFKPTRIRIPKVDPNKVYQLHINRTQVYGDEYGWKTVVLKKHEFDGFVIPHGTTIRVDCQVNSAGFIDLYGDKLNGILKTLYLDTLRTIKKGDY